MTPLLIQMLTFFKKLIVCYKHNLIHQKFKRCKNIAGLILMINLIAGCQNVKNDLSIDPTFTISEEKSITNENLQSDIKISKKEKNASTQSDTHLKKYIITKSNAKQFTNWKLGKAEIILITQPYSTAKRQALKVGEIKPDGNFDFDLPSSVWFDSTISDFFKCQGSISSTETQYTEKEVGLIPAFLSIRKSENEIGVLSLATSKQQAYNNSPFGKYQGHLGYRLELWYAEASTNAESVCKRTIEATDNSEITKQIQISDIYNLSFKKDWNYVKVAIQENQKVGIIPYYKTKKYTVVNSLPNDVRWVFKEF